MNESTLQLLELAMIAVEIIVTSIVIMLAAHFSHAQNNSFFSALKYILIGTVILAVGNFLIPNPYIILLLSLFILIFIGSALGVPGDMFLVFIIATFVIRWLFMYGLAILLLSLS